MTSSPVAAWSAADWEPLPDSQFDADAARHLLRRAGWAALPGDVDRAVRQGLSATLDELFPARAPSFPKTALIQKLEGDEAQIAARIRTTVDDVSKRQLRKELRDRSQQVYQDLVIKWLQFAADPAHAATEKWVLFLSDVYVVAFEKVHNPALLYQHHDLIRTHAFGPAPVLSKQVSRSPAMIDYLDLKENKKGAPNENFARELFELFVLGEGHYTEADIKEAARAFTGYRQEFGVFRFAPLQHDFSPKRVFGQYGNFDGDAVIDIAYRQPAARTFLPGELVRFYFSDEPLPREVLQPLGDWWHDRGFDLRALAHRMFGSRLFFSPYLRNNYIKSPLQFYLGLVQDLDLDVAPLPRQTIGALRQMGQIPFNPPNVRGWVGGKNWINSSTLAARRQVVQVLSSPLNEAALNADEQIDLVVARTEGRSRFRLDPAMLQPLAQLPPADAATKLVRDFLSSAWDKNYAPAVADFLAPKANEKSVPREKLRAALITLLDSPAYQLC